MASLNDLSPAGLAATRRLLVVASTYGEGEPPDTASSFARRMARGGDPPLALDYAILALGDREYPDFWASGHRYHGEELATLAARNAITRQDYAWSRLPGGPPGTSRTS